MSTDIVSHIGLHSHAQSFIQCNLFPQLFLICSFICSGFKVCRRDQRGPKSSHIFGTFSVKRMRPKQSRTRKFSHYGNRSNRLRVNTVYIKNLFLTVQRQFVYSLFVNNNPSIKTFGRQTFNLRNTLIRNSFINPASILYRDALFSSILLLFRKNSLNKCSFYLFSHSLALAQFLFYQVATLQAYM